jgi:hypothetical protein
MSREYLFHPHGAETKAKPKFDADTEEEHSHEKWIENLRERVIAIYPELEDIDLSVLFLDPKNYEQDIRGSHMVPDSEETHGINIDMGGELQLELAKTKRPVSVEIAAKLIGIAPEHLTSEVFNTFVFLHEYGHAHDFVTHYQNAEASKSLTTDQMADVWHTDYVQQRSKLPIPNTSTAELIEKLSKESLVEFLKTRPVTNARLNSLNLKTTQEVINAQDAAYRSIPKEKYADAFAASFIKKYLPEIIRDIEKSG